MVISVENRGYIKRKIKANNKKEYMKQYHKIYYIETKAKKLQISAENYQKNRKHLLELRHQRYLRQRTEQSNKSHKQYYEIRREIFRLLGNKCSNPNCAIQNGMTDIRTLQIDHVNGGGLKEVKSFPNTVAFYKFVLTQIQNGSKNYQLLCANCNQIKRYEKKEGMSEKFKDNFLK